LGHWVSYARAAAPPFSDSGPRDVGAGVGAGLIAALPAGACGLAQTARIARYLADESAGQRGPCVFGLDAIAGQMERLAVGRGADLAALDRWIGQLRSGRGACKHPDGTVAMFASALRAFESEVTQHLRGWCTGATPQQGVLPVPPRIRQ